MMATTTTTSAAPQVPLVPPSSEAASTGSASLLDGLFWNVMLSLVSCWMEKKHMLCMNFVVKYYEIYYIIEEMVIQSHKPSWGKAHLCVEKSIPVVSRMCRWNIE